MENDLQLRGSYESSAPCTTVPAHSNYVLLKPPLSALPNNEKAVIYDQSASKETYVYGKRPICLERDLRAPETSSGCWKGDYIRKETCQRDLCVCKETHVFEKTVLERLRPFPNVEMVIIYEKRPTKKTYRDLQKRPRPREKTTSRMLKRWLYMKRDLQERPRKETNVDETCRPIRIGLFSRSVFMKRDLYI